MKPELAHARGVQPLGCVEQFETLKSSIVKLREHYGTTLAKAGLIVPVDERIHHVGADIDKLNMRVTSNYQEWELLDVKAWNLLDV
jgi:hypothetical protein